MTTGKEALNQLMISEDDLLNEAAEKSKGLLAIEEKTGNVILRVPRNTLPARSLIHLYLIGAYFANKMGKTDFPSLGPTQISIVTGIDNDIVSARLSELVSSGSVRKTEKGPGKYPKGEYYINPYTMNDILDEILSTRASGTVALEGEEYPDIGKHGGISEAIIALMQSPWGMIPRDWKAIQNALRHNSMIFSDGSLTGTLTLLYQNRRLKRIKEGRAFKYTNP